MKRTIYYIFAFTLLFGTLFTSCGSKYNTKKLTKKGSLAGYRVAVQTGSTYDLYARKHLTSSIIVQSASYPDEIIQLEKGKVDVVLSDLSILNKLQTEHPNIVVQNDSLYNNKMGVGFSMKRKDLRDKFNIFLKEIRKSGMYDQIYDRWINHMNSDMPVIKNDGSKGVITCQTDNTTAIFSYVKDGKPAGFDMEIVMRFGAWMHQKIDLKTGTFATMITALSTGAVDMGTASIAINPERAKKILFSDVFYSCNTGVITLKSKMAGMKSAEGQSKIKKNDSLAGLRVAVQTGSVQEVFARKHLKTSTLVHTASIPDKIMLVKTGKVDVSLFDSRMAKTLMEKDHSLIISNDSLYGGTLSFGFNKQKTTLLNKFNQFLKKLQQSGEYAKIYDKWFNHEKTAQMPAFENKGTNGTIVCQTDCDSPPHCIMRNGKLAGFNIELVERFTASVNMKLVMPISNLSGIIASVTTGKADMTATAMCATPERKKNMDFSNPYCYYHACGVALRQNVEGTSKLVKNGSLAGRRVVVQTGSTSDLYARQHLQSSSIVQTSSISDDVLLIRSDKADVALCDRFIARILIDKNPDFAILTDSIYGGPVGLAFSKNRTDLRDKFNVFLANLRRTGQYQKIYDRWYNHFGTTRMPNIPNRGTRGTIICQTTCDTPPYCIMRNGELQGLGIELTKLFAASLNMKVKFLNSNFAGVVAAVSMQKADMSSNVMAITDERAKKIAFSDLLHYSHTSVITMKDKMQEYDDSVQVNNTSVWKDLTNSFKQNFIVEKRYEMVGDGLLCTLEITILAGIFGTILGALICYLRMRKNRIVSQLAKAYILIFRGIPQVVLLMILFYAIFASSGFGGITVSVIGFSLVLAAYVSEMFRTSISSISHGQTEAGLSMGFTPFQTFRYIVLPLTIRRVLPVYKGEIIGLIKSTSIVGYITVQDLTKVSDIIRSSTFDAFMPLIMITIVYFIIIWLSSLLLDSIDMKYKPKESRFYKIK